MAKITMCIPLVVFYNDMPKILYNGDIRSYLGTIRSPSKNNGKRIVFCIMS